MPRTKTSDVTRNSSPGRRGAKLPRARDAKADAPRRHYTRQVESVEKKPPSPPQRGGRKRHWAQMLHHPLMGLSLAVASVVIYWLHPPSYIEGLIIVLDVSWVLQQIPQVKV